MKTFNETQTIKGTPQGWVILGASLFMVILGVISIYTHNRAHPDNPMPQSEIFLVLGFVVLISGFFLYFFFSLHLSVVIGREGIAFRYPPFVRKRFYSWQEIEYAWVRSYNPLIDYGGWGYRGIRRRRAFSLSGKHGIQILTKDGRQVLVGVLRYESASAVLKDYGFDHPAPEGWQGPARRFILRVLGFGRQG